MQARTTRTLKFRWANHHAKDFKPGDPEVTFELPPATFVEIEDTRMIKTSNGMTLTFRLISYKNPLSGMTSRALVDERSVDQTFKVL